MHCALAFLLTSKKGYLMNVFDWDGTIYHGDSSKDFVFYCFKKYKKARKNIPKCLFFGFLYGIRIVKKLTFKQKLFSFVKDIEDIDKAVLEFWDIHEKNIHKWYLNIKKPDDVVISASPEFLLEPICKKLGIGTMMASKTDKHTGKFDGKNCHGEEKVRRFRELMPDAEVDEFYSDLYCDTPMARLAKRAYIVKGEKLTPWKESKLK